MPTKSNKGNNKQSMKIKIQNQISNQTTRESTLSSIIDIREQKDQSIKGMNTVIEYTLLNIYNSQRKLINYRAEGKGNNLYFASRIKILIWIDNILNSTNLKRDIKNSIYHRFSYGYSLIFGILHQNEIFFDKHQFKVLLISLFLIVYKMEGYTINKLTIKNIFTSFLKSAPKSQTTIEKEIKNNEIDLCSLLDYDIFILENNIHQLSQILLKVLSDKFSINQKNVKEILSYLPSSNRNIDNSNNTFILFNLSQLEKAAVSLFSVFFALNDEHSNNTINQYINYFSNELQILNLSYNEIVNYSKTFSKKLFIMKTKGKNYK